MSMALDIRTMMVMTSLLTLLLAGLLALASRQVDAMRGIRHWALAELCMGLGLGLAYTQLEPPGDPWIIVLGSVLLAAGMNLQLLGIQAFRGRRPNWYLAGLTVAAVLLCSAWFSLQQHDIQARSMINSLIFALINLACVRALLVRDDPPMRNAYRFAAGTFALVALLLLVRAAYVAFAPPGEFGLYAPLLINPVTFFFGSVLQLILTFGFVLMMHRRVAADLHRLAARDSLTGALNRRSLEEQFDRLRALYLRSGGALALMMIDIDHFKVVNDRHGHLAGDEILCRLAALGEATVRRQDYFARYGGEEFCVLLPATAESEAMPLAERLRLAYAQLAMGPTDGPWFSTISIGVADSACCGLEFAQLVAAADQALYQAKHQGRNRVVAYSAITPEAKSASPSGPTYGKLAPRNF